MSSIETSFGTFEAHARQEHVDIERDGEPVATYSKYRVIENLREKRRIASFISNTASVLKTPVAVGIGIYDASIGILRGDKKRILRGLAIGTLIGKVLGRAEVVFDKEADIAGIHQEVIEEAS